MHCNKPPGLQFLFVDWKPVIQTLTQKFILISLLCFKEKSVHLFWNSCKPVIQTFTQMFILISLLCFKEKSVHLFWNSCKPVIQTFTQIFILISLLPSKGVFHGGGSARPPLWTIFYNPMLLFSFFVIQHSMKIVPRPLLLSGKSVLLS